MKNAIVLLATSLLISGASFANCNQNEAQFKGTIQEVKVTDDHCSIKVDDFSIYNMHMLCPLLQEDLANNYIELTGEQCSTLGDEISGVAVEKEGKYTLE